MPKDTRKFTSRLVKGVVRAGEAMFEATCITSASQFDNPKGLLSAGGMCSCCGAGGHVESEHDWWLVFKGGLADSDGVFYAMLCGGPDGSGCLGDIRAENAKRTPTERDEAAAIVADLMGDDVDGAEAFMDDLGLLGF